MDLLPKTTSEFTSKEYWENFFQKRGQKAFEWYGEYNELCGILHKYMKPAEKILVIGCGNSRLGGDLYDVGYHGITNIDISDTVIKQMVSQNQKKRPDLQFLKMDVTKMEFEDSCYNVVFDKGTLDALMPDTEPVTMTTVMEMMKEIDRVLRLGGRYMCVTLAQPHILDYLLKHFSQIGWMIRVCRVPDKTTDDTSDFHLPVFVIVLTKFKKMPNMKQILEVCTFDDTVERVESISDLEKAVQAMQHYGVIRQQLSAKSHVGENISLNLYNSSSSSQRYTLCIVDNPRRCKYKFAIFIVPEGRETEWLFCTPEGQLSLNKSAGYERLIVVTLHRDHQYLTGMDGVKAELSSKVMELAPPGLGKQQVPFLSAGGDINTRKICYRGSSSLSGQYVVEDVDRDGLSFRRLVFLDNPGVIQSEVKLTASKSSGDCTSTKKPEENSLTLEYYKTVVVGLAFLENMSMLLESGVDVLLVGLGGGSLPQYLHNHFTNLQVNVVELDPEVLRVATDWFGFHQSERLKVTIADGIQQIATLSEQGAKSHLIILDVDNKDLTVGMSSPPQQFVQPAFLKMVHSILHPEGVVVLNLICRNADKKQDVVKDIKSVFSCVFYQPKDGYFNETVYALSNDRNGTINIPNPEQLPKELTRNMKLLQDIVQSNSKSTKKSKTKNSDVVQLTKALDILRLL